MADFRMGLDARLLGYRYGIGTLLANFLAEMSASRESYHFVLYVDRPQAAVSAPRDPRFEVKILRPRIYPLWEQFVLPRIAAGDRLDALYCPANTAPVCRDPRTKVVLTINDVIYLMPKEQVPPSPSFYQQVGRLYYRRISALAADRASALTTISHTSKKDIIRHLHVNGDRIQVVYPAANQACRVIKDADILSRARVAYSLGRRFVLALGQTDPRKNTDGLIRAYALLDPGIRSACPLVLAGMPPSARRKFRKRAEQLGVAADIVFLGFVPEEDLAALYNLAEAFVYPSFYEGFGLPVLEAMTCGTPVITSPRGSIPEIAGDAPIYVDPEKPSEISEAIGRVLCDADLSRDLSVRGRVQAGGYSWSQTAASLFRICKNTGGQL